QAQADHRQDVPARGDRRGASLFGIESTVRKDRRYGRVVVTLARLSDVRERKFKEKEMPKLKSVRLAVLATHGVEESELLEPVDALRDAGAWVTIVSLPHSHIQLVQRDLEKTIQVKVDRTIGSVSADEFDALHLPGGTVNADSLRM